MVTRVAIDMDRHDGGGARRDERLDLGRIEREGVWLNITKDRRAAMQLNRMGGRHKSKWRGDDLTRELQGLHSDLQRYHAIGEETHVLDTQILSQCRLELLVELAVIGQPLGFPYLLEVRDELDQGRQRGGGDEDGAHEGKRKH